MEASNPIYTPMDSKVKIEPNKEQVNKETIKIGRAHVWTPVT